MDLFSTPHHTNNTTPTTTTPHHTNNTTPTTPHRQHHTDNTTLTTPHRQHHTNNTTPTTPTTPYQQHHTTPTLPRHSGHKQPRKNEVPNDSEMAALQACAATLCCGPVYDPSNLNGGGDIYLWLCKLLNCHNDKVFLLLLLLLLLMMLLMLLLLPLVWFLYCLVVHFLFFLVVCLFSQNHLPQTHGFETMPPTRKTS